MQALAVQHPSWLPFLSDSVPHVTVSVAEGVPAREAGDLIRDARVGQRARIAPLVGVKLLHGGSALPCLHVRQAGAPRGGAACGYAIALRWTHAECCEAVYSCSASQAGPGLPSA